MTPTGSVIPVDRTLVDEALAVAGTDPEIVNGLEQLAGADRTAAEWAKLEEVARDAAASVSAQQYQELAEFDLAEHELTEVERAAVLATVSRYPAQEREWKELLELRAALTNGGGSQASN